MALETRVLGHADVAASLARGWDALPAQRGVQADVYDSHAWFESWRRFAGSEAAGIVRIPVVLNGDRPVGLLPLIARSSRRWESVGRELRTRFRPVLGSELPDEETLGLLAEAVSRTGAREVTLHRLPSRDPATDAFATALTRAGFRVYRWERSTDCLATVEGGWEEHRQRFQSYDRTVKAKLGKISRLWEVTIDRYGPGTGTPVMDGFEIYTQVHERSWKGTLAGKLEVQRQELLRRTEELGWPRLYVLRVAGIPAAAHIWFRLGRAAIWLSTAYDRRLAAISPGTVVMWRAQRAIFEEAPPRVLDFLPGHNPQKDRLGPEQPPLVVLEGVRKTAVSGITFPVRREFRHLVPAIRARLLRSSSRRDLGPGEGHRVRTLRGRTDGGGLPVAPLQLDASALRYLAVAGGHAGPESMTEQWENGDTWWRVGAGPGALLRLGSGPTTPRPVREIVLVVADDELIEDLLSALATELEVPVTADVPAGPEGGLEGHPIPLHKAILPWPAPLETGVEHPRTRMAPSSGDPKP